MLIDEFFITLVKIRLGILHQDIAYRTNIAESDVSTIFHKWLDIMYCELQQLIAWPDRDKLYETLPRKFKKHFCHVITIIDCFELFIEKPCSFNPRSTTYSQYKKQYVESVNCHFSNWVNHFLFSSMGWLGFR